MKLGERIRSLRIDRAYTQKQLGEYSGVSQSYISALERGESEGLESVNLGVIAKALGIDIADLLFNVDELPQPLAEAPTQDSGAVMATVTVESGEQETIVSHSKSAVDGKEEQVRVVDRQVTDYTFTAPPARVGAEFRASLQISSDLWSGVRIWTERPCAVEDIEATRTLVIAETREALDRQYRQLLHEAAAAYKVERPDLKIV